MSLFSNLAVHLITESYFLQPVLERLDRAFIAHLNGYPKRGVTGIIPLLTSENNRASGSPGWNGCIPLFRVTDR